MRNPLRALDDALLSRVRGQPGKDTGDGEPGQAPGRGRRRGRLIPLLTIVVLVVVAFVAGAVVLLTAGPGPRSPGRDGRLEGPAASGKVQVGVADGQRVKTYLNRARTGLAELSGTKATYALVSFTGYATPGEVNSIVGSTPTGRAFARVPLPGVTTAIEAYAIDNLARDLPVAMARTGAARAAAANKDSRAAGGLSKSDPAERAQKQSYLYNATVERAESKAYRAGCSCVYALVVRAAPASLKQLATKKSVRVVDAAPKLTRLEQGVFLPLLPEQTGRVGPLPASPHPSPSAADPTG